MKRLFLIRGLPGSGKSTLAALLVELACRGTGNSAVFYEADDFFVDGDGIYRFNPTLLGEAHIDCKVKTYDAMEAEIPLVIVSNTFSQNWEFRIYESFAEKFGYEVTVLTVESGLANAELTKRNEHGCPEEKIGEMRGRWEDYISPVYVKETA